MALTAKDKQDIKNIFTDLIADSLADITFRIGQAYEVEARNRGAGTGRVFAEDIDAPIHLVTGYTVTANSPSAGLISWADVTLVYNGVTYPIPNGSTTTGMKYVWWDKAAPTSFKQSAEVPNLTPGSTVVFYNDNGTPREALSGGVSFAVGGGVIGDQQVAGLSGGKITSAVANATNATNATTAGSATTVTGSLGSSVKVPGSQVDGTLASTVKIGGGQVTSAVANATNATTATTATNATNLTGTIGSGVSVPLSQASGTLSGNNIANGAITPTKMTLLQHILV